MGKYNDLEIIKKLKDDGDMTSEEFENEKQKILSKPDDENTKGMGLYAICTILGVCSLIFSAMGIIYGFSLYVSIISGISAVVLGIVSRKKLKANKEKSKMVTTGIITGLLGAIMSIVMIGLVIYSVIIISSRSNNNNNNSVTTTDNSSKNITLVE